MIKTLYQIISPEEEFELMGRQISGTDRLAELARVALREYQKWQIGLLNEQTQKPFEDAVQTWRDNKQITV